MRKIILIVSMFFLFGFGTTVNGYSQTEKFYLDQSTISKIDLVLESEGKEYMNRIDRFVEIYGDNKEVLNKVFDRLQTINKDNIDNDLMLSVLLYFESEVYIAIHESRNITQTASDKQIDDTKREDDIKELLREINIKIGRGNNLADLIIVDKTYELTINNELRTVYLGRVNFDAIGKNQSDYQDVIDGELVDYPIAYSQKLTGEPRDMYKFVQIATISDKENKAVVVGNFYKMEKNDSKGLILNEDNEIIVNKGESLPYGSDREIIYTESKQEQETDLYFQNFDGEIIENEHVIIRGLQYSYAEGEKIRLNFEFKELDDNDKIYLNTFINHYDGEIEKDSSGKTIADINKSLSVGETVRWEDYDKIEVDLLDENGLLLASFDINKAE